MSLPFAPFAGAVVRAWMPESERVCAPGPKFRPVLLLAEDRREDGTLEVLVAYGTSQNTQRFGCGEFVVSQRSASYLDKDTKFCLQSRMWLPLNEVFFTCEGKSDVMGQIPESSFASLKRACEEAGLVF